MGTMKVTVDAETEGKQVKFDFLWDGEGEQIARVLDLVARQAAEAGITPERLATNVLHRLPAMGLPEDPGKEEPLVMLVLNMLLRLPIPDHPEVRLADVAMAQDITADLSLRNGQVTAEIHGQPRAH
jgi:hypothetical protein